MKPKQHLVSFAYRSMFLELSTMLSFRNVSDTMIRFLHKDPEHEVKVSTLEGRVESQGKALTTAYMEKAASILESHNIDAQSGIIDSNSPIAVSVRNATLPDVLSEKSVRQLITDYNRDRDTDTKLKYGSVTSMIEACAEDCCYISIDDIGVRFQKEERNNTYKKKQKFIENTVIHIQKGELQYTITAIGMKNAFMQLVAFCWSTTSWKVVVLCSSQMEPTVSVRTLRPSLVLDSIPLSWIGCTWKRSAMSIYAWL